MGKMLQIMQKNPALQGSFSYERKETFISYER